MKLFTFDGNPKNWLQFWAQFKTIHEDSSIEDAFKFQYLLQSLTDKAQSLVGRYPASAYQEALSHLRTRYGDEDVLIEIYIRELISLIINAKKSQLTISDIYDYIEGQLKSLNSLGVNNENFSAILYPLVEACLPDNLLTIWNRNKQSFLVSF